MSGPDSVPGNDFVQRLILEPTLRAGPERMPLLDRMKMLGIPGVSSVRHRSWWQQREIDVRFRHSRATYRVRTDGEDPHESGGPGTIEG